MVHHCSPRDRPQGQRATDTDDREMFRIRSGNPVDSTEGSYAVGDDKSGGPVETRVSICRIRRIEFIAVSDPLGSSAILYLLNKLKIEIPGYTEDVANPDLFQSPQQEITDCLFHRFRSPRLERLSGVPIVNSSSSSSPSSEARGGGKLCRLHQPEMSRSQLRAGESTHAPHARSARTAEGVAVNIRDPLIPCCLPRTGHRPGAVALWAVFCRSISLSISSCSSGGRLDSKMLPPKPCMRSWIFCLRSGSELPSTTRPDVPGCNSCFKALMNFRVIP